MTGNTAQLILIGLRYIIRTATLPNFPSPTGTQVLTDLHSFWQQNMDAATQADKKCESTLTFQPLPRHVARETNARGGNAAGLTEEMGDHIYIEMNISWTNRRVDEIIRKSIAAVTDGLNTMFTRYVGMRATHTKTDTAAGVNATMQEDYYPLFPNDATWDQGVYRSFRESERLGQIQKSVDPDGFFSKRTVGWRFS
jgi:hypothetical protein